MKYKVDGWNNFCWVFELPDKFPNDYCFDGGIPVLWQMVDWFNPIEGVSQAAVSKEVWVKEVGPIEVKEIDLDELSDKLIPWMRKRTYVSEDKQYLILFDFGASLLFRKEKEPNHLP